MRSRRTELPPTVLEQRESLNIACGHCDGRLAPHTSWCGKGALARQSKHRTPGFSADSGDQGSLCSVATAGIELDELDEEDLKAAAQLPRNSRGINLSDEL